MRDKLLGRSPYDMHHHEDHYRVCQRVAPLGFVARPTEFGCVVVKGLLLSNDGHQPLANQNVGAWLASQPFGNASFYTAGTFTHTWNSAANHYFVSSHPESKGERKFEYKMPGQNNKLVMQAVEGMTPALCNSIAGKWVPVGYSKSACMDPGPAFGMNVTNYPQTAAQPISKSWLEGYIRDVHQRTSVLGQTTPPPAVGAPSSSGGGSDPAGAGPTSVDAETLAQMAQTAAVNPRNMPPSIIARPITNFPTTLFVPGTFACCTEWHGWGADMHCSAFSTNDKESCEACESKWMSILRWRSWTRWIKGLWKSLYKWKQRAEVGGPHVWQRFLSCGESVVLRSGCRVEVGVEGIWRDVSEAACENDFSPTLFFLERDLAGLGLGPSRWVGDSDLCMGIVVVGLMILMR